MGRGSREGSRYRYRCECYCCCYCCCSHRCCFWPQGAPGASPLEREDDEAESFNQPRLPTQAASTTAAGEGAMLSNPDNPSDPRFRQQPGLPPAILPSWMQESHVLEVRLGSAGPFYKRGTYRVRAVLYDGYQPMEAAPGGSYGSGRVGGMSYVLGKVCGMSYVLTQPRAW